MKPWRKTEWNEAFDKRDSDPNKNYGIRGMSLRFLVGNELGVVQLLIYTNWQLRHVQEELDRTRSDHVLCHPMPADLGYHSPIPQYDGQTRRDSCEYLEGRPCYYDGSGLNAEPVYWTFVEKGEEAMWKALEEYHASIFHEPQPAADCGR